MGVVGTTENWAPQTGGRGASGSIQVGVEQPWRASSLSRVEALGWFRGRVGVRVGQGGPPLFQRGPVPRLASAATNSTGACVGMLAWVASSASSGSGARNGAQPAAGLAGLLCVRRPRCVGAAARAQGRGWDELLPCCSSWPQQLTAAAAEGWQPHRTAQHPRHRSGRSAPPVRWARRG